MRGVSGMNLRTTLKLPKEHGAWAMLYVPFAVGALVASSFSFRLLLLLISVTFVFIARESILTWFRARSRGRDASGSLRLIFIYIALAGFIGAPLFFVYHLYWLAGFGLVTMLLLAANTYQALQRKDRTIAGEMMGISGLTLTAPAAYYVSRGEFEPIALWLWILCALYFLSSVFYVKLRVNTINPSKAEPRKESWNHCAVYHAFLLAILVTLTLTSKSNLFVLAAFSPVMVRSLWHMARPVGQVNLRRVGFLEIVYSITFLIFATLTFRGL